ncbi:MAG: hypothetical protein ACYTFQ_19545, partial [Planctomycetota bacterium]
MVNVRSGVDVMDREGIIVAVIVVCCARVAVYADMTPVSHLDATSRQVLCACRQADWSQTDSPTPFACFNVTDLNWRSLDFLPEAGADLSGTGETLSPHSLTSGPSSLNLCLSALVGLALCSSAHCVNKLHFRSIPQWYHEGGPSRIGHSLAVDPDSVYPMPVCCFIQPDNAAERLIPQYRIRTV